MKPAESDLLGEVVRWLEADPRVEAAVLYGSRARPADALASPDRWSDIDLHVIASSAFKLREIDWAKALPGQTFCLRAVRSAVGGVDKVTVVFAAGEVEIIHLPASRLRLGRVALRLGWHRRLGFIQAGLNVLSTGVRTGYRFLKGEATWGDFYRRVATELPGLRVGDAEIVQLAEVFLSDLLCVFQRLGRGELAAAQHALHRRLAETNFTLVRELQLRRGGPVPSFEVGRRVETLLSPAELAWVQVDARLDRGELHVAAWQALAGLESLMRELVPGWSVPPGMLGLLQEVAGSDVVVKSRTN